MIVVSGGSGGQGRYHLDTLEVFSPDKQWFSCSLPRLAAGRSHCNVMYCTILYCTILYCTVLYCTVLYCRRGHTMDGWTLCGGSGSGLEFGFQDCVTLEKVTPPIQIIL